MQVKNATAEVAPLDSAAEPAFKSTHDSMGEANELQQRITARAEELQNTATSINSAVQNAHQVDDRCDGN